MAGLDGSFPQMSPENCRDVYKFAIDYLTSKISQGGDPCIENTRGSLDWLNANFKHFSKLATYQDLVGLNPDFNALDAVAGLSPWQLADYTLGGGVLRDTDKARKVFGALDSQDIAEFMDAFNTAAKQHHLSQLPHLEIRRFVLGEIFCHLSGLIHLFTPADYDTWFGQRLHFFLSSLNAQNLGFLPSDLSCDSLAAIVSTLKDHHGNNTFENPEDIYSFIKRVLHFHVQNSDSACVQGISTDKQWLERFLGPFTIYGSYSDFTALKSNFHGSDSLDLFSARALAELSVQSHTVYSTSAMKHIFQTIRKKTDAEQFLGIYLDEFNSFVMKNHDLLSNINIRDALLMLSAEINFPQMSALSLKDMAGWLERLNLLLPGINGTMLELLPLDMSCPYFQAVVKALDSIYSTLSSRKRQDVYGFQKTYLTAQFAASGSACDGGTIGIQDLLLKNFGKFCSMAKLSELQVFYPELNGVEKPPVYISPKETADFTKIAQMLQNATLARHAIGMIKNFSNYYSLREYLSRLQKGPCQDTSSPSTCRQSSSAFTVEIQQEILENALFFLKKEGSSMNSSQWTEAYFLLFSNILPHPRTAHLSQLAPKLSCRLHTILKAITALHPSLIKQEEELAKVRPLCYPGKHHPNIKATTHILAKVTKYSYQDETHSKHRIGTTFPHQTSKSRILRDTTKQNLESSPDNKVRSKEMDTTGRAIIHNLRNNTSGFFESVANKPIPIPGGATKSILQSIITHISGIPRFTSPQSARTNTLGDATNDVTRNTTDDLTGNITTHGLGRTSRHISGSSRTDIPRTTIVDIHRRTSRWIPNSVTQISRSDSNDIFGRGNIPESAMLDISESTARWSTAQMFEKTTSGFHGNITHHYPKSFATEMPNDIIKLENTITYIPGNGNSKILASGTDNNYGNSSTCTIPHNYGGSTSRIQESISANFHETDKTHIPGYTTENILMDSRIHSLAITVENNSSDTKGNIYEIAITHNPADATVNQHTVHILESKNENVSHSVMKNIHKSSIPPSINDAMGMPEIISDYTSRSTPAEGVTDNIPSTFTGNILGNTAGKSLESITAHFPSVRSSNIPGDAISNYFEGTTFHNPGDAATSIPTNNITHNFGGTTSNILKNEGTTSDVTDNLLTGIRRHILGNALGNTSNASANTPRNNLRRLTIQKPKDVNSKFLKGIVTNIPEDAKIKTSSEVTANIDGVVTSNLPRDVTFTLGTHSNWTDVTRYISKVFINVSQSAVGNIPNDDLAHVTDNMLENITIHTQGNIDTMGNSPRDAANNIPGGTTTSILGSVINNVSEDTSVHSRDGVTSKFSSSITFQMVTGATVNILKSITASVLRSTTEGEYIPSLKNSTYNILHGATGNLSGETAGNVNGGDTIPKTYDATGNKPKISITHSPGNGAMNYISGGVTTPFFKSSTGNMFQSTTSNIKKIAMGYDHKAVSIHEGTMGNISGGAIIHIPGDTTASVPGTNKNLGSAISNNEAPVISKARNVTATISIASGGHHISSDLTVNISKGTIPEGSTVHIPSSVTENKSTLFLDGFSSNITISVPDHIRDNDYVGTSVTIPGSIMGDIPQNTISGVVPSIASDNDRNKDATPSTDVITPIFGGVSVKLLSGFTSNHAGDVTSNIPIDTTSIFKDATVSIPMGSTKHNLEDKATHVHDGSLGNSHNDATGSISQKFTSPISGGTSSTISTIFGGGPNHLPGKGNEDGAPGGPNHDSSGDVTTSIFIHATTHDPNFVPDKGNSWANNTVPMSFYCVLTWISVMVSL